MPEKVTEKLSESDNTNSKEAYPVLDNGAGWYEVNGKKFRGEAKAKSYRAKLLEAEQVADTPDQSDVIPEEFRSSKVREQILKFRNSLLELPMNETQLPDGTTNPWYDRQYYWGWASYSDTTDVADKQTSGWDLVSLDDFEAMIEGGAIPSHYRNLVRGEGRYLVYGDLILMRKPRFLWRQHKAERDRRALESFKQVDDRNRDMFDNAGMRMEDSPIKNELTINY
jgi:hypothetical protein